MMVCFCLTTPAQVKNGEKAVKLLELLVVFLLWCLFFFFPWVWGEQGGEGLWIGGDSFVFPNT